jgi:hypothetical protein
MLAVNIFACLDLEQIISFMDGHYIRLNCGYRSELIYPPICFGNRSGRGFTCLPKENVTLILGQNMLMGVRPYVALALSQSKLTVSFSQADKNWRQVVGRRS